MSHNLRAKKPTPKVNKSGFSGPDSRYKPPRDYEEVVDEDDYEDYSQPEPYNCRQPTPSSAANQSQKQKQPKPGKKEKVSGRKNLNLNAIVADSFDPGYEYVFDRSTGEYLKQAKKSKTVPVPVHEPVPVPQSQPELERQPESAKKKKEKKKRKSVSEPQLSPTSSPRNKQKQWVPFTTLPAYFYPSLTAILFALLAAHYLGGSSYIQRTGLEAWQPNPIAEVAETLEASVVHPRKVLSTGVVNKERYKNFYAVVKEYCGHVTKGSLQKARYVEKYAKKKPAVPPSLLGRTLKKVSSVKIPRSWGEVVKNIEYYWWRYGYFVRTWDEYYPEYPTREALEICEELKVYIRQAAGEDRRVSTRGDLETSLLDVWMYSAELSLNRLHGELDWWVRDLQKRFDKGKGATRVTNAGDKIIEAGVGGDGVVFVDRDEGDGRSAAPVWGLNVTVAYPLLMRVRNEFVHFRLTVEDTLEKARKMDALLGAIMPLAEELISKHQPEEWLVWTKLPEQGVEGITEVMPGWGAMSFKSLRIDETDLTNAFRSVGVAQKSWGNVRVMVREFRTVKARLEQFVEGRDGELALLEKRIKEVMNKENWVRSGNVQGLHTLRWKYLELSDDLVQDLKDKANKVDEVRRKLKKEEWERIRKRLAEDVERAKKAAEEAVLPKDKAKWVFKGGKMWYVNAEGVWT